MSRCERINCVGQNNHAFLLYCLWTSFAIAWKSRQRFRDRGNTQLCLEPGEPGVGSQLTALWWKRAYEPLWMLSFHLKMREITLHVLKGCSKMKTKPREPVKSTKHGINVIRCWIPSSCAPNHTPPRNKRNDKNKENSQPLVLSRRKRHSYPPT